MRTGRTNARCGLTPFRLLHALISDTNDACLSSLVGQSRTSLLRGQARIIAVATLKAFDDADPVSADARQPVMAWYHQVKAADWSSPADVNREIRSASILKDGRAAFNIAGNKYRIVVWINYPCRVAYIRFIGSHQDYDAMDAQTI